MNNLFENVKKALIICAHPDDETIFCGGTMLTYPKIEWEIVCMTYGLRQPRGQEFRKAMDMYKGFGVNIPFYCCLGLEDDVGEKKDERVAISNHLQALNVEIPSYDLIITHNTKGEYGHLQHIQLNRAVDDLPWKLNIWEFICPGSHKVAPQPFKEKVAVVPLTRGVLAKKTEIFNTCYKSQLETWRARPDVLNYEFWTGPEMFTGGGVRNGF